MRAEISIRTFHYIKIKNCVDFVITLRDNGGDKYYFANTFKGVANRSKHRFEDFRIGSPFEPQSNV